MESNLERNEQEHNFLCFCSLICILNSKKLNLPNIFLMVMKNPNYKSVLSKMLCIDNVYDLFSYFIIYEPSLSKSKYVSKFLNSKEGIKLKHENYGFSKGNIQPTSYRIKKSKKSSI